MGVLSHFCDVQRGVGIDNLNLENVGFDADAEDTLYSGRVCYKDANGEATEGHGTDQTDVLFFVNDGIDQPSVVGSSAVSSNLTDNYDLAGGTVSLIPFRQGIKVRTSEFDDGESYSIGDGVEVEASDSGILTKAADDTSEDVVAVVADEVKTVHDLDVLTVEVIRQAPVA